MKKMMMICAALLIIPYGIEAQGKKKVKKNGIVSCTAVDHENGRTMNDRKKVFNSDGEITEDYDYNSDGALKKVNKYQYSKDGELVEEVEFRPGSNETVRKIYRYDNLGEKTEVHVYDGDGRKQKVHYYKYNPHGLKIERITRNPEGITISVRKYTYVTK